MRSLLLGAMLLLALATPATAQTDAAAEEIRARLEQWKDAFNAGRKDEVCDLFSHEAIAQFRGQPERTYNQICDLLQRSLSDAAKTFRYGLEIREILVYGDVAVVRLTWTLHISPLDVTTVEPGMDIFHKEPDGKWRIVRYLAYEAP